jgi:hypothetical protein
MATITLAPNDNLLGVTGLLYSIDGGVMQNYQGAFNINGVGEHRVTFFATDAAGNVEAEKILTYTINPGPLTLSIIPMLQCVQENPNNSFTAIFGYQNNNPSPGTIPIGDFNKVTPATLMQNQPTYFQVDGGLRFKFAELQEVVTILSFAEIEKIQRNLQAIAEILPKFLAK